MNTTDTHATPTAVTTDLPICYHCGETCPDHSISDGKKLFCCRGCKTVYQLLAGRDLCTYYNISDQPGTSPQSASADLKFGYLDDPTLQAKLIDFSDGEVTRVSFHLPSMHCASCIYLLESLYKLEPGIVRSQVDFLHKQITLTYRKADITLKEVVALLASIGYEPQIRLEEIEGKARQSTSKRLYMQLGVAGFAFGNIMLLSFPEYLSRGGGTVDQSLKQLFAYISLGLSLPVIFFSASTYLVSAWQGLRRRIVNLDVPISLGILSLFLRSVYEIVSHVGAGYLDSLAGLIFLLLIGRVLQERTYGALSFDRDYTAYFPIAATKILEQKNEQSVPVTDLTVGDRIKVRNQELIPADSILMRGTAHVDYSFVTGEADPVAKECGDVIYAGGRQIGSAIELEVIEEVSRSYLTRLWNSAEFTAPPEKSLSTLANRISKYFVAAVLMIATASLGYWWLIDPGKAVQVFTAVLIVACPCALALATPFTLSTAMQLLSKCKLYLKNAAVIETLARVNTIVFDKTGTLTDAGGGNIHFEGAELTPSEAGLVRALSGNSNHPLSMKIFSHLTESTMDNGSEVVIDDVNEIPGSGIEGIISGKRLRLGSRVWIMGKETEFTSTTTPTSEVFLSIDGNIRGRFLVEREFRAGVSGILNRLKTTYKTMLLSGDNEHDRAALTSLFPEGSDLRFNQSPRDKMDVITASGKRDRRVLMIGDGLNDAGALQAADVGFAITEQITAFSPASDGLLDANSLQNLDVFLKFARASMHIIVAGFILSFAYNIIGLGFAVAGKLSPLVSAILMPLSSITVVVFASTATRVKARLIGLHKLCR